MSQLLFRVHTTYLFYRRETVKRSDWLKLRCYSSFEGRGTADAAVLKSRSIGHIGAFFFRGLKRRHQLLQRAIKITALHKHLRLIELIFVALLILGHIKLRDYVRHAFNLVEMIGAASQQVGGDIHTVKTLIR